MLPLKKPTRAKQPKRTPEEREIIRRLEEALAYARNGHVESIALILLNDEGYALDCWYNGGRPYVMVGALEALKLDFIMANIEQR
ncbi:hypothetical protein GZZ44_10485 [Klebsiella aerogenes]|nr:hypothetical protein [Klebsiella aerogenes]